uniref:Uncharacterized protein n=1 Tax=Prymnesium polylepis TaxID=72548 RepID=A0A6V4F7L6_9EUKA|mmetsp:Transcript_34252/g.94337  ORF Transcript_34252/g.94337 Transcript_34252/m.94337 type:complete len:413 (-) Transcript_34252:264-1502(-)
MKYNTAPMRLNKRGSTDDLLADAIGDDCASFGAGSWPKSSRRRTSRDGMSLWELKEALTQAPTEAGACAAQLHAATAPAADDDAAFDDLIALDALDALVADELSEFSEELTREASDSVGTAHLVDAVFGLALAPPHSAHDALVCADRSIEAPMVEAAPTAAPDHNELLAMLHPESPARESFGSFDEFEALDDSLDSFEQSVAALPTGAALDDDDDASPVAVTMFDHEELLAIVAHHRSAPNPTAGGSPASVTATSGEGGKAAGKGDSGRNGGERKEWTNAEDEAIRGAVAAHGCKWRVIAAMLPGRSDDAVRNRWSRLKSLESGMPLPPPPPPARKLSTDGGGKPERVRPERVSWSRTEDETILQSVHEIGTKWHKIANRLPGRTDHAIRNRFHRLQTMYADGDKQLSAPVR